MDCEKSKSCNSFSRPLWVTTALSLLFLSILRGIRLPNLWSYTHFLFDYRYGFIKRGLIGQIFKSFDSSYLISYNFFSIFSFTILALNILLFILMIKDLIKEEDPLFLGISLVFASSIGIVFFAHTVGYSDHIGLLITLTSLRIKNLFTKALFTFPALICSIFIHEAIFVIFFPVILISFIHSLHGKNRIGWMVVISAATLIFLSTLLFVSNSRLKGGKESAMHTILQKEVDRNLRRDAFHVLTRDRKENFSIMKRLWSKDHRYYQLARSLAVTLPATLFFIIISILSMRRSGKNIFQIFITSLAPLSPLTLHLAAWDMHRWDSLTVITSFLTLHVVLKSFPENLPAKNKNILHPVLVLLVFLNGVSTIPLFDRYYVKNFPFEEHRIELIKMISSEEKTPFIPNR